MAPPVQTHDTKTPFRSFLVSSGLAIGNLRCFRSPSWRSGTLNMARSPKPVKTKNGSHSSVDYRAGPTKVRRVRHFFQCQSPSLHMQAKTTFGKLYSVFFDEDRFAFRERICPFSWCEQLAYSWRYQSERQSRLKIWLFSGLTGNIWTYFGTKPTFCRTKRFVRCISIYHFSDAMK